MSLFFIDTDKDYTERFDIGRFMRYENENHDPLTSAFIKDLKALKNNGRFVVQGEEFRPDLISDKIYGTTQHWWIILLYNDVFEIDDITNGVELNYPSLDDLDSLFFNLKAQESAREA